MTEFPKVIGFVPTYNSESFLKKTLLGLANQDYQNFEIWICDDVSTDGTSEICKELCECDHRFKFFQNETNQGWWKNSMHFWKSCSEASDYCFFNPHDDIPEPSFISQQVDLLEKNPLAVLCVPGIKNFYPDHKSNQTIHTNMGISTKVSDRIIPLVTWEIPDWWAAYHGIHRSKFVLEILPIKPLRYGEKEFALDLIWLIKLATFGPFVCSDRVLFEKHYSKNTLSSTWDYNFINRSSVYLAMLEVTLKSSISNSDKAAIFTEIFRKAVSSITNKFIHRNK